MMQFDQSVCDVVAFVVVFFAVVVECCGAVYGVHSCLPSTMVLMPLCCSGHFSLYPPWSSSLLWLLSLLVSCVCVCIGICCGCLLCWFGLVCLGCFVFGCVYLWVWW